ncbi:MULTISPECIES: hypothetical protein [Roseobacteraceae]|uniref:hypothetical protein n=1 Tax=Roseobacteraceae TaxID=2854170 RepID=UPI001C46BABE|nr:MULTISPECIES: hypothetical protein [Roseobacteraceae]MBV7409025.1 hypothetical protein [Maritimibacter sp. DP1N21-5]MBY5934288.1 hypothetical protein [Tateyamaria omphalii]
MSAPDTDVETQTRKHWFVLAGLGVVVLIAGVFFVANVYSSVDDNAALVGDDAQMIEPQS